MPSECEYVIDIELLDNLELPVETSTITVSDGRLYALKDC